MAGEWARSRSEECADGEDETSGDDAIEQMEEPGDRSARAVRTSAKRHDQGGHSVQAITVDPGFLDDPEPTREPNIDMYIASWPSRPIEIRPRRGGAFERVSGGVDETRSERSGKVVFAVKPGRVCRGLGWT